MRRCLLAAVAVTALASRYPGATTTALVALTVVAVLAVGAGLAAAFRPRPLSW